MPNDEKKPKPFLVEEVVADPELVIDLHLSKGDVATAKRADVAAAPEEKPAPGRVSTAEEARRRMTQVQLDPEAMVRAAALLAGMPQVEDEIDDAQARAFARRRHEDGAAAIEAGPDPVPPPPPNNLPARIERNVFARDPDWVPPPAEVQWLTIYDTPRYYQSTIRSFGRFVFRTFPCFENHERQAEAAGHDPLGSIALLANMGPTGPSPQYELDQVAAWISRHGRVVDADEIRFPTVLPGYAPRIIVAVTETETLLLVDEKRERGSPVDAMYIYRWRGGEGYYLDNPPALARFDRVTRQPAIAAPPRRLAPPQEMARQVIQPPEEIEAPALPRQIAAPAGDAARPGMPVPDRSVERKAAIKALPVATSMVTSNPVIDLLKADGFRPFGTSAGPALRKSLGEGRVALIFGEAGVPINRSQAFRVEIEEAGSRGVVTETARTFEDILDAVSPPSSQMRP